MNKKKKAAIQLSLGFIITVVFAVVLLSLAVTWLRGMVTSVSSLTDDLTQKASDALSDTFNTGTTNFAVYPGEYSLAPGKGVRLSVGVKNDHMDGQPHQFVVHVYPAMSSSGIVQAEGCSSFSTCESLKDKMMSWTTYPEEIYTIQPNQFRMWDLTVSVPNGVVKGIYQYDIVACEGMSFDACDRQSTNWGSTLALTITVK